MTSKKFENCFEDRVQLCREVLCAKNKEYARGGDKLSNFKKAAALQSCEPSSALYGMLAKHLVSIADLINDREKGKEIPTVLWEEKIGDALNYLFLLDAVVKEDPKTGGDE